MPRIVSIVLAAALSQAVNADDAPGPPEPTQYGPAKQLAKLANRKIKESSGLACSRAASGVFWTHNDSGDRPRVYAFDVEGKHLGMFRLAGAEAVDWEDMASFEWQGKSLLLLADIGDNFRTRSSYTLYFAEEPALDAARAGSDAAEGRLRLAKTIRFRYEDGANDCESVAVDLDRGEIILISKRKDRQCKAYRLALPDVSADEADDQPIVAEVIAGLQIPTATAMDISPDGLRAVVLTYGDAYEYRRAPGEDWTAGFSRPARRLRMPKRDQGETICFGPNGTMLYLTSEKLPCPLWRVAPLESSK